MKKRKCAGECVAKLEPTCTFGTWRAFDLGNSTGSSCPYLYAAEAESTVEVSCLSARDLFEEFADDKETINLIYAELVKPAAKAGCDYDVIQNIKNNQQQKQGSSTFAPPGIKKKKTFRKSFYRHMQERVMSSANIPRLSTVKSRTSSSASNLSRFDSAGSAISVTPQTTPRRTPRSGTKGNSKNSSSGDKDAALARMSHDFRRECGRIHNEVSAMRARVEDNAEKMRKLMELIHDLMAEKKNYEV